ncbi:MAG: protoheme IX farnesyltransferase [Rhodanobacteraceae bacterium]|nr:protoheme IX farnesyltransferase [Rhodanobacteraceae bacterium]MBK7043527.1 protoheme IX farnesyltransferase [Rhodanobacteraceae bacterium]MBP9153889.1 heme o synthase [Xanthomonadales bacterium]HQW82689.1 heme o synthase [Pseudomonadota bacterium]
MNTVPVTHARSLVSLLHDVLGLMKLRIGVMIMLTALVGMVVTPAPLPGFAVTAVLALSVLVASASAGMFNQYFEADEDHRMARTRRRAFVTGALPHSRWWLLLMATMLILSVAAAWRFVNPLAAGYVLLGALFYGVVYTVWLKRRTPMNIVIGGLAGSFAVLAGGAAVAPFDAPIPLLLALVLFLWTPPHFWSLAIANRQEYADAGVPMLPVVVGAERAARAVLVGTVLLTLASLLPAAFGLGSVYFIGALAGGLYFIACAVRLVRRPERAPAMRSFFASLVQLSLLLVAACLDRVLV